MFWICKQRCKIQKWHFFNLPILSITHKNLKKNIKIIRKIVCCPSSNDFSHLNVKIFLEFPKIEKSKFQNKKFFLTLYETTCASDFPTKTQCPSQSFVRLFFLLHHMIDPRSMKPCISRQKLQKYIPINIFCIVTFCDLELRVVLKQTSHTKGGYKSPSCVRRICKNCHFAFCCECTQKKFMTLFDVVGETIFQQY